MNTSLPLYYLLIRVHLCFFMLSVNRSICIYLFIISGWGHIISVTLYCLSIILGSESFNLSDQFVVYPPLHTIYICSSIFSPVGNISFALLYLWMGASLVVYYLSQTIHVFVLLYYLWMGAYLYTSTVSLNTYLCIYVLCLIEGIPL